MSNILKKFSMITCFLACTTSSYANEAPSGTDNDIPPLQALDETFVSGSEDFDETPSPRTSQTFVSTAFADAAANDIFEDLNSRLPYALRLNFNAGDINSSSGTLFLAFVYAYDFQFERQGVYDNEHVQFYNALTTLNLDAIKLYANEDNVNSPFGVLMHARPLHLVASCDDDMIINYLLSKGANPLLTNRLGLPPIDTAIRADNADGLAAMFNYLNDEDLISMIPKAFRLACRMSRINALFCMVEQFQSFIDDQTKNLEFNKSAYAGRLDIIQILEPYITDINAKDDNDLNALHYAIQGRQTYVMKRLIITCNAVVDDSAFIMAREFGNSELLEDIIASK
jgi:hypothetical protein